MYSDMYHDIGNLPDPERQPEFYVDVPSKRLLAWIVDTLATVALVALALPFTAFIGVLFIPFLYLVIGFAYRTATLSFRSATWGMRLAAIEMRQANGQRFDGGTALLHTLGYTLSMAVPIVQIVSVIFMATGPRGQGLTDMVLGTTALNKRRR